MIRIDTQELQSVVAMLNKVERSNMLEMTNYWHINCSEGVLTAVAYDGNTFLRVQADSASQGEIDVIVSALQFGKLIDKVNVPELSLEVVGNHLLVRAGGEYKVEIQVGEKYIDMDKRLPSEDSDAFAVDVRSFRDMSRINSSAVSTSIADGFMYGYLMDGGVATTTDGFKMCVNPIINDYPEPLLIRPQMLPLITSITDEAVGLIVEGDYIYIYSDTVEILGLMHEGVDDYPIQQINEMVSVESESELIFSKVDVLSALDRLTLFIGKFDSAQVNLHFTAKGLKISTKSGSFENIRTIDWISEVNDAGFKCIVNAQFMKDVLNVLEEDNFIVKFNDDDVFIRFEANSVMQVLTTVGEE